MSENKVDIILKTQNIKEAAEILDLHLIEMKPGWEIMLGMLLNNCDSHLEVHGIGSGAYFKYF